MVNTDDNAAFCLFWRKSVFAEGHGRIGIHQLHGPVGDGESGYCSHDEQCQQVYPPIVAYVIGIGLQPPSGVGVDQGNGYDGGNQRGGQEAGERMGVYLGAGAAHDLADGCALRSLAGVVGAHCDHGHDGQDDGEQGKEAGNPEAAVLGGVSAAVDVLVGLYGDALR